MQRSFPFEQTDDGRFSEYEDLTRRLEEKFPELKAFIADVKVLLRCQI